MKASSSSQRRNNDKKQPEKALMKVTLSSLVKKAVKSRLANQSERAETCEIIPREYIEAIAVHCHHSFQSKPERMVMEELNTILAKLSLNSSSTVSCIYLIDILMTRFPLFANAVNDSFSQWIRSWEKVGLLSSNPKLKQIREYIVQMTELWSITFGDHLHEFASMHKYLVEGLQIKTLSVTEKFHRIAEEKEANKEQEIFNYFGSLDRFLRVNLPEIITEVDAALQRLQESFDQLFNNNNSVGDLICQPDVSSSSASNICTVNSGGSTAIDWDLIEWEQDDEDYDPSSEAIPAISGDMRIIIDPLEAANHPDKAEILQAISSIAAELVRHFSVLQNSKRRIDEFISQYKANSSIDLGKRKRAPTGYEVEVLLELAESKRVEVQRLSSLVKVALRDQCRTLLNRK